VSDARLSDFEPAISNSTEPDFASSALGGLAASRAVAGLSNDDALEGIINHA
jgi:hypothetical protein